MQFYSNKIYVAKNTNQDFFNSVKLELAKIASKKVAKEKSEVKPEDNGLSAAQKKLPIGLQNAILKRKKKVSKAPKIKKAQIDEDMPESEFELNLRNESGREEIDTVEDDTTENTEDDSYPEGDTTSADDDFDGENKEYDYKDIDNGPDENMGAEEMGEEGFDDEGLYEPDPIINENDEGNGDGDEDVGSFFGDIIREESSNPRFIKISNLTDKQKTYVRKYWANVWPKEFIDSVLSI